MTKKKRSVKMPLEKKQYTASMFTDIPLLRNAMKLGAGEPHQGYKLNGFAFRAVRYRAQSAAAVPWTLMRRAASGEDQSVTSGPLVDLMKRPNPRMSFYKYMFTISAYLDLFGACYILGVGPNNKTTPVPRELHFLHPTDVEVKEQKTGALEFRLKSQRNIRYDESEVLYLPEFNPDDQILGFPASQVSHMNVRQLELAKRWNASTLERSARPSGLLKSKTTLMPEDRKQYKEDFNACYGGADNAGSTVLLEGDLDWERLGFSPQEMEWISGMIMNAREVAITYGVPAQLLGDSESQTYSNYQEARKALYQEEILPLLEWIVGEHNHWLVPKFDNRGEKEIKAGQDKKGGAPGEMFFQMNVEEIDALQADRNEQYDRVSNSEFLEVNEKRKALGLEEVGEEGDQILVPQGLTTLERLVENATNPPEPPPVAGGVTPEEEPEEEAKSAFFTLGKPRDKKLYFKSFEGTRARFLAFAAGGARRVLVSEGKAVLELLEESGTVDSFFTAIDGVIMQSESKWLDHYADTFLAVGDHFAQKLLVQAARATGNRTGPTFETKTAFEGPIQSQILAYVREHTAEQITGIGQASKSKIKRLVGKGLKVDELKAELQGMYVNMSENRSLVIARTEVVQASNLGSHVAARELNVPLMKTWEITGDGRERDSHFVAEGLELNLNEPYVVGGEKLMFPGDVSLGASADNIIQCRCVESYRVV